MDWTKEKIAQLRALAPTGMIAADIGVALGGFTQAGVINVAARHGIAIVKYSPEQQAIYDHNARHRDVKRLARKKAARQEAKIAARKDALGRRASTLPASSSTSPRLSLSELRKLHAVPVEMTKGELRAFLTQAVRNTAEASL